MTTTAKVLKVESRQVADLSAQVAWNARWVPPKYHDRVLAAGKLLSEAATILGRIEDEEAGASGTSPPDVV